MRSRTVLAGLAALLAAVSLASTPAVGADAPGAPTSTTALEHRQKALDERDEPALRPALASPPTRRLGDGAPPSGGRVVSSFGARATATGRSQAATAAPTSTGAPWDLRTSLLTQATSVDPADLTFSWKSAVASAQTAYRISLYACAASATPLLATDWVDGADQTSVTAPAIAAALQDNQLYYWQVEARYADGSAETSGRQSFVTAVGSQFESTQMSWTAAPNVSNLVRASVSLDPGVEKAMLSVTALDTEAARRNVYEVFVNGADLGAGPTRRAGSTLYYNTFDVTSSLAAGRNVIGLYNYSQAADAGFLMQLTYFYADGTSRVVYNSATDRASTQILAMDTIMYGTSNASIGTEYYTELAQNADTTRFPYRWQTVADFDSDPWPQPVAGATYSYRLAGSIVPNATRRLVTPASLVRASDGSCTVAFSREIVGDVQLTVSSATKRTLTLELGEELSGGRARYRMRTTNTYLEHWLFKGTRVTFSGFSLMAFRYLTIGNCPASLRLGDVKGISTGVTDAADSSFASSDSLLNSVYRLGRYSQEQATQDTLVDSVTRERRPYEADTLIYQSLADAVGDDDAVIRNTWNYLLARPSQYTEYRLMTVMGVYEDYLRTGDLQYVRQVYPLLCRELGAIAFNPQLGLARANGTIDLVDWPLSELAGFNFSTTVYKTVVNVFAEQAYLDLGRLAAAIGSTSDASGYLTRAAAVRSVLVSRLYDGATHGFRDGLTAAGRPVAHESPQDDYVALAYGIWSNRAMADALADATARAGRQQSGSIYSAYFMYQGLYASGHADLATELLANPNTRDARTYASVLSNLGATISPEAWSPRSKPNMTFSHVWGSGGAAAMIDGVLGVEPLTPGGAGYQQTVRSDGLRAASASIATPHGVVATSFSTAVGALTIRTTVPPGASGTVVVPSVSSGWTVAVDGVGLAHPQVSSSGLAVTLSPGSHSIVASAPLTVRARLAGGHATAPVLQGGAQGESAAASWYPSPASLRAVAVSPNPQVLGGAAAGSVQCSTRATGGWSAYAPCASVSAPGRGSAITAIRLTLTSRLAARDHIRYRIFSSARGWLHWQRDGSVAAVGAGESIRALQVTLAAR